MGSACSPVFDDSNLPDEPVLEPATLESIAITPGSPTIKRVLAPTQQLTAIATYSDSSTVDVTTEVSWSSSDATIAAVDEDGVATAATAPGTATISATLDGVTGMTTLTANDPTLVVTSISAGRFDFFSMFADGNVAPKKSIVGPSLGLPGSFGVTIFDNELYVAELNTSGINVYPLDAVGDTPPTRRIAGPATKMVAPYGIIVTKNEIYVCGSFGSILVFPRLGNGNVAPIREISGGTTQLSSYHYQIYLRGNELFVPAVSKNAINVYPADATGDVAPTRQITGAMTGLTNPESIVIKDDELFVAGPNYVRVFPVDAVGDVAPKRMFTTTVGLPGNLVIVGNELVMPTYTPGNSVITYPITATGTPTPLRTLTGAMTNIVNPLGITIY